MYQFSDLHVLRSDIILNIENLCFTEYHNKIFKTMAIWTRDNSVTPTLVQHWYTYNVLFYSNVCEQASRISAIKYFSGARVIRE